MSTETMTSSGDWMQYYQHNLSGEAQTGPATNFYGGQVSDSTVVTTTFTSTSVPSPRGSGSDHLSPDGRVSKPTGRRRSRASRRTPTTLLKTDTNNFRAMVQQFTGGSHQALSTGFQHLPSGANFSFVPGNQIQQAMNPAAAAAAAVAPNRHPFQFQQQQLRTNDQQQYHQVENQQQYHVFSSLNNFDHVPVTNAFLQRLDGSRTTSVNDHNNNNNSNSSNNNNFL